MVRLRLDPAAERGIWMGLCFFIVYYTFFNHDYDFGVIQGNPLAYGWLWYLFNPIHNSRLIWGLTTIAIYFAMLRIQFTLVKRGKLSKTLVYLNMVGVMICEKLAVQRDVTVIMFAPLASMNPLWIIPMFLQKFGLNRTMWEQLTPAKAGVPIGPPAIFEWQYVLLLFWFMAPSSIWAMKKLWNRFR